MVTKLSTYKSLLIIISIKISIPNTRFFIAELWKCWKKMLTVVRLIFEFSMVSTSSSLRLYFLSITAFSSSGSANKSLVTKFSVKPGYQNWQCIIKWWTNFHSNLNFATCISRMAKSLNIYSLYNYAYNFKIFLSIQNKLLKLKFANT